MKSKRNPKSKRKPESKKKSKKIGVIIAAAVIIVGVILFYPLNTENGRELNSEKPIESQQVLDPNASNAQKVEMSIDLPVTQSFYILIMFSIVSGRVQSFKTFDTVKKYFFFDSTFGKFSGFRTCSEKSPLCQSRNLRICPSKPRIWFSFILIELGTQLESFLVMKNRKRPSINFKIAFKIVIFTYFERSNIAIPNGR